MLPTRKVETEVSVYCQCCHDIFGLEVLMQDGRILRYGNHPHIVKRDPHRHNKVTCRCGGALAFFTEKKR